MTIRTVRARALAIPLARATSMSTRTVHAREYVLVWVDAADGASGAGYTYVGTTGGALVRDAVNDVLRRLLVGQDEADIEGLWARMYQEVLLAGRRGALLRAMSAVDIALWDLAARRANVPLARLLGGWQESVPAYASGGYYRDEDPLTAIEAEIRANMENGFTDHKIKVGGAPVALDAERVRVARQAIGAQGRLALDANNAYRTPHEAIRAARAFERAAGAEGVWWFEEPLSPEDIAGHAEVARALETPVATGEIHQTRWDFRDLIERRAADILQPDAGVVGGISEWLKIAHTAASFNLPLAPHWHANLHVHLAAATGNVLTIEHFALDKDIYNFEHIVTEETRLRPSQGRIKLPTGAGLGFVLGEAAVDRYTLPE
jgi:L-alanine-DL-glutamate epimerase-like enolase superfamily enzyme